MELSDKIRIIRKARGFSQESLGDSLSRVSEDGISRQSVSDWENGKSEPKLDNIRDLAQVLNVSFDALLDESIDLNDQRVLNSVLANLSPEIKQTVNRKFRYSLRVSTLSVRSFHTAIVAVSILILTVIFGGLGIAFNWESATIYIFIIGSAVFIGLLPTAIIRLISIAKGKECVSIGELNNTHLILHTRNIAENTLYIPIEKIEKIIIADEHAKRQSDVSIFITGRTKALNIRKLLAPQKFVEIFGRLTSDNLNESMDII